MPDVRRARLQTAKPSAGLHANGFALLPIEAGAIREACPSHVSADAQGRRRPARRRDGIAALATLKRHRTLLRQVWFFELHNSDAIWVVRAVRVDHTNPVR